MIYKNYDEYDINKVFETTENNDEEIFDIPTFEDSTLRNNENWDYFLKTKKPNELLFYIPIAITLFLEMIDESYEGAACFLECLSYIPIETVGKMFEFDIITIRIEMIPNELTAQISIILYPYYQKSIFNIVTVYHEAVEDATGVWVKLLSQQILEYKEQLNADVIRYCFLECSEMKIFFMILSIVFWYFSCLI